jgi:hypothetical protein
MTVFRSLKLRAEYPLRGSSCWSIVLTLPGEMTHDDVFRPTKVGLYILLALIPASCALRERDPALRTQRLQSAKNAIMDRIEDSFDAAYGKESRLLLAALNTISQMQGAAKSDGLRGPGPARAFGQLA